MGSFRTTITPDLGEWISKQPLFFVATAPLQSDGHIDVSPIGLDSFRIIDERTVAYLDQTGSGAETVAHVARDQRCQNDDQRDDATGSATDPRRRLDAPSGA